MKRTCLLLVGVIGLLGYAATALEWETDFEQAKAQAERQGRFLLVDFSGSDWCGWCIKLDKEVFSQAEFKKYADANLVLVLADFPKSKKLPKKVAEQNKTLASTYGVRGYPTVVLLLPNGDEVARTGYQKGGAEAYVAHLQGLLAPFKEKLPKPDTRERKERKARQSSFSGSGKDKSAGGQKSDGGAKAP